MKGKIGHFLALLGTALVLGLCAWLPSLFSGELPAGPQEPDGAQGDGTLISGENLSESEHRRLWCSYRFGTEEEGYRTVQMNAETIEGEKINASLDALEELIRSFQIDGAENIEIAATGQEYILYSDPDGRCILMLHYYRQWTGDWRNWMELYLDVDTLEVYYIYTSSACLQNNDQYIGVVDTDMDVGDAVTAFGELFDMEPKSLSWSGDPEDYATAQYVSGDDVLTARVDWKYAEKYLYDIRYELLSIEEAGTEAVVSAVPAA